MYVLHYIKFEVSIRQICIYWSGGKTLYKAVSLGNQTCEFITKKEMFSFLHSLKINIDENLEVFFKIAFY